MRLIGPINTGQTAGGAGVSTANATTTTRVEGMLVGVYVKYNGSPPAGTTDVTVKTKGGDGAAPTTTFLTLTNAATSGWFFPRINIHNTSGSAQAAVWDYFPIWDFVTVTIAQANDADSADVWLMVE